MQSIDKIIFWLILIIAIGFWLACVVVPFGVDIPPLLYNAREYIQQLQTSPSWSWGAVPVLIFKTIIWGLLIAISATLLGIPAALLISFTGVSYFSKYLVVAFLICSLCLPAYLGYWVWGLLVKPDTWLASWIYLHPERADFVSALKIWWGLTLWSWPIASFCLATSFRKIPCDLIDMAQLDGASALRRLIHILIISRTGIVLSLGITFLATLTSYVVFDLGNADTYGNALRRFHAETYNNAGTLFASIPMQVFSIMFTVWLYYLLNNKKRDVAFEVIKHPKVTVSVWIITAILLGVSLLMPALLLINEISSFVPLKSIWATEGKVIVNGLVIAGISGLVFAVVTTAFAAMWSLGNRLIRLCSSIMAISWIWISLIPSAATGAMLVHAYNRKMFSFDFGGATSFNPVYHTPFIVLLGYLARYGIISVWIGRWIATNESATTGDLRKLDSGNSFMGWVMTNGPQLYAPLLAVCGIGAMLSLSEVSVSTIIYPADWQSISENLLNRMHYAREDYVISICLMIYIIVIVVGIISSLGLKHIMYISNPIPAKQISNIRMSIIFVLLLSFICIFANGCDSRSDVRPNTLSTLIKFGSPGRSPGQLVYPRAIDIDVRLNRLYIIDKTGRIQLFSLDGKIQKVWMLPEFDQGFPTGITVNPDTSEVYIADTHEHRVLKFSPEGEVIKTFGTNGKESGQFIFPTDIAFDPNGILYVSEYGGNDRIQAFSPDGEFLFTFGEFGYEDGQFNRPQSMVFDQARNELIIADSCNHRIVFTDPQGKWLRTIGSAGINPGQLSYPYGLLLQPDGSLLISEFGNNRVQHMSRNGESLGIYGTLGYETGEIKLPWSIAGDNQMLYILDSGNNRVQAIKRPG